MSAFARLTARQNAAILALAAGKTHFNAAKSGHINVRTLRRWLQNPDFAEALDVARRAAVEEAVKVLRGQLAASTARLKREMRSAPKPSDRIKAAGKLLDHASRLEEAQLHERVERLEQLVGGGGER
jgi:hypothetical protein